MRLPLLASFLLVCASGNLIGQMLTSPPEPNYDRTKFQECIGFHNTNRHVFIEDYESVLEFGLDNSFTIEFWIKIPSSIEPGTTVLRTSNFDINFGMGVDSEGNYKPGLIFLTRSYYSDPRWNDPEDFRIPETDYFYHMAVEDIHHFNEWFHVAIVRNRQTTFQNNDVNNTPAGSMRMYINGVSSGVSLSSLDDLVPLDDGGIYMAPYYTPYMKLDELRIWGTARSAHEIYTYMNEPIDHESGLLTAYYSFDGISPGSTTISNESRGWGSPGTNGSELAGHVGGSGSLPVFRVDKAYTSISDGDWNNPDTWNGEVPGEDEIITIAHSITMNESKTQAGLVFRGPDLAMRSSAPSSTERIVYTDGHTLTLLSPPTGGNDGNYIATTDGGNLVVENIPYTGATIPVGTETTYRPVGVSRPDGRFFAFSFTANDDITPSLPGSAAVVNAMWDLAPVNEGTSPSSYKITFQWTQGDESGAFSRGSAQVANYHNNQWNLLSTESLVDNYGIYSLTATASEFSPFIITSDHTSLPVRLVGFDVRLEGPTAVLTWSASDAENFAGFEVERSVDAEKWTSLGREAASGQGRELRNYSFADPLTDITSFRVYYRIKMVDHDNSYTYSPVKSIGWSPTVLRLGAYPNPAEKRSEIRLQFPGDLHHLKITSLYGMEVYRESGPSQGLVRLPDVASGIYILSARDSNGQIYREKILVR